MKANTTTAGEAAQATTNALIYKTSKVYIEDGERYRICVELRLDDGCKNGYENFAFTCDGYRIARDNRAVWQYGGCCHDQIIKHCPGLIDDIVNLHLCDFTGAPSYAVENTFYFIKEHNRKAVKSNLYVCGEEEIDEAMKMSNKDKLYFAAWLEEKHIPERWKESAQKAIAKLEGLMGKKFESKATKSNFKPLTGEEKQELDSRIKNGYYSEEAANKRIITKIDELIAKDLNYYEDKASKLRKEIAARTAIFSIFKKMSGASLETFKRLDDGFIIYNYNRDEIAFNWCEGRAKVTDDEIAQFMPMAADNDILKDYVITNKNK